jgi:ribosomal protein L16/L10AE
MARYQICYVKHGQALVTWTNDKENAQKMADGLRKAGYIVDVWAHTKEGTRKIDL